MCTLADKTALITGSGKGIGRAIAVELARAGSRVVIAATRLGNAESISEELVRGGYEAIAVRLDVTDKDSVRRCIDETIERVAHIDVLVNNAGVFQDRLGFELQDDAFNRCLDVNLTGIWRVVQALVPHFKAQGGGKIINIASNIGRCGLGSAPAYSASKAAVINLTQSLATALGPDNVNVNAICPGSVETAMLEKVRSLMNADHSTPSPLASLPLARMMTAEDIAHAVVFFASDYARSITGQALNVDRGQFMS